MDMKKVLKNTLGAAEMTGGVALKLAELGLKAVDTVFCGMLSVAVKESDMKMGRSLLLDVIAKPLGKKGQKLINKGEGRL